MARLTIKSEDIYTGNKKTNTSQEENQIGSVPERSTEIYTILGKHEEIINGYPRVYEDDDDAYAKRVLVKGQQPKFYIKTNAYGHPFNPIGKLMEGSASKVAHTGRKTYEYRLVTQRVFNFYIDFLKTKNDAYYNNAMREIM